MCLKFYSYEYELFKFCFGKSQLHFTFLYKYTTTKEVVSERINKVKVENIKCYLRSNWLRNKRRILEYLQNVTLKHLAL